MPAGRVAGPPACAEETSLPATDEEHGASLRAFLEAVQAGNIDGVLGLLAPEAIAISDGGAHHHAARRPVAARPGSPGW